FRPQAALFRSSLSFSPGILIVPRAARYVPRCYVMKSSPFMTQRRLVCTSYVARGTRGALHSRSVETELYRLRFSDAELTQARKFWRPICGYLQRYVPSDGSTLDLGAGYCHFINA